MKRSAIALAALLFGAAAAAAEPASPPAHHHGAAGAHAGHHHTHTHGTFAAGRPGKAARAKRTVRIEALDSMRFEPPELSFRRGETVRLVFVNRGQLPHEAVIGSTAEQQAHEEEMQRMAEPMAHHHPNAVSLPPGATGELVWQFSKPGRFEIGCHERGHYQAGMIGRVRVR